MTQTITVLLLPGWLDSGPGHWQTLWESQPGFSRVQQHDWQWPRRGDWMARLEEVILGSSGPVLLAAHSLGCHLAAAWSAHSAHGHRAAGALLVAPPDLDRDDTPTPVAAWRPAPRTRLPFPSVVVASDDDPFASIEATKALADDWGAALWRIGPVGHVNAESGLGDWPEGLARLLDLAHGAR